MENLEDFKTVLEIVVILITLAQTFPPLAFLAGVFTLYYILKEKEEDEEWEEENWEDEEQR
jgi:hypothetical protein